MSHFNTMTIISKLYLDNIVTLYTKFTNALIWFGPYVIHKSF